MKIRPLLVTGLAGLTALCMGCASMNEVKVMYYSDPGYASLYQNGTTYMGKCPVLLTYPVSDGDKARGYVKTRVETMWPSGAKKYSNVTVHLNGPKQHVTIRRPANAPNAELDYAHALERERLGVEQERTQLMERDTKTRENNATLNSAIYLQNNLQNSLRIYKQNSR